MSAAFQVPVTFSGRAQPILDALARMRRAAGSVPRRLAAPGSEAPHCVRLLAVALGGRDELRSFHATLLGELAPELHDMAIDVTLRPLPLDGVLVVFNQVVGVEQLP